MTIEQLAQKKGIENKKFNIVIDLLISLPEGLFSDTDELADYLRFFADNIESKDRYAMAA